MVSREAVVNIPWRTDKFREVSPAYVLDDTNARSRSRSLHRISLELKGSDASRHCGYAASEGRIVLD
jgi:hypothetical protein